MVFKWRDNHTDRFLNLYKGYEFLWDFTNPLYKNRVAREAAYKEIIEHMKVPDLSVRDVKNKIKTVRTNYKYELNKVLRSEKDGADPSDVYVPHLFWFKKADKFLRNISVTKAVSSSNSDCLEEDDNATQQSELEVCNIKEESTSYSITEDNTTQQSELEPHEIKLEDTKIQEVDLSFQNSISDEREKSPTPPAIITSRKEIPTISTATPTTITILNSVQSTIPAPTLPRSVLTLPPDITISKNELCSLRRPAKVFKNAITVTRPTNEATIQSQSNDTIPILRSGIDIRKRTSHLIALEKSVSKLQRTIELQREGDEDEFDLFGKSLALQLKRMPLERALICQENLQRVMIRERLQQNNSS